MDLDRIARSLGLYLNSSKTDVLEGEDVATQALEVEHSAVDDAIENRSDYRPLEELVDRLLVIPERASRTSIAFAAKRMRDNDHFSRAQELLVAAPRMPHVADKAQRLFKRVFRSETLQDWYLNQYVNSNWARYQWAVAHYGRMFPSHTKPGKALREFFAAAVRDANTNLPLLATASQRLAAWDEKEARSAFRDGLARTSNPHARRVLVMASLGVGESRIFATQWLGADTENNLTLRMLEDQGFSGPKVQKDFSD